MGCSAIVEGKVPTRCPAGYQIGGVLMNASCAYDLLCCPTLCCEAHFMVSPCKLYKLKQQSLFCAFLKAQMPDHHLLNGLFSHGGREKYPPLPLTLKSLGFFLPVQHLGFSTPPPRKITSRYPRKLKFKGLIAYIMFYKICKFENLTITNDIITKNNGKIWYVTLTSIKFDPDNQDI